MNQKTIITFVVALLVVGGGSFYGGMKYGQSKNASGGASQFARGQGGRGAGGQGGQFGAPGARIPGGANGGGFVNGDIIAKDDKSITVKDRSGGSKIIFFSDKTQVVEAVGGKIEDLAVGKNVVVNGTTNPDGSITSQIIQVRLVDFNASTTPGGR